MKTHQQALDIAGDYDNLSDQIQAYIKARGMVLVPEKLKARVKDTIWLVNQLRYEILESQDLLDAAPNPFEGEE